MTWQRITDDPAPSLHAHYRRFTTTTSRSASAPRDGTHTTASLTASPATPSRPHGRGQYRGTLSQVPCKSRRPRSCRLHAERRLANHRALARPCSRSPEHGHGFDVPLLLTTLQQRFGFTHLPGPHLTPHRMPFPSRSPRRSSPQRSRRRFEASPRRATPKGQILHLPQSTDSTELDLPHHIESSFIVHDARPGKVG